MDKPDGGTYALWEVAVGWAHVVHGDVDRLANKLLTGIEKFQHDRDEISYWA